MSFESTPHAHSHIPHTHEHGAMLPAEVSELFQDIGNFFIRWHTLEGTLGNDGGSVLDFDFYPRDHAEYQAFSSRFQALTVLESLRERLDAIQHLPGLKNATYLRHKLLGSSTYLRALMGQRFSFHEYLSDTMGIEPEPIALPELQALREQLEHALARFSIPFSENGAARLREEMLESDHNRFSSELCMGAETWVHRLRSALSLSAAPHFKIEIASVDAYWANWIDGSLADGIRLRINVHPRITYYKGAALGYAVHEIGGHALHVLEMNRGRELDRIDSPIMNLTVHSCEAFQMEGLAQSVLELMADPSELSPELKLDQALRAWHGALLNNAHLSLEGGIAFDKVVNELIQTSPFMQVSRILSDMRDRMKNPLFRSYIHVYNPSRRLFLTALKLPMSLRIQFLQKMYTMLYTPEQIRIELKRLQGLAGGAS